MLSAILRAKKERHQYLIQVVAACCILYNICEVHNDGFDETWQVVSTDWGTVSASGSAQVSQTQSSPCAVAICEALITYFETH